MSESEMQAELERLRAENAQLKNKDEGRLMLMLNKNSGLSISGMRPFPATRGKENGFHIRVAISGVDVAQDKTYTDFRVTSA